MELTDIRPQLPIHSYKRYKHRKVDSITTVVIHHSGYRWRTDRDSVKQIIGYANYHVGTRGWPGIAYHYVIDPHGECYKCNATSTITYHARGGNTKGLGVMLIGNFMEEAPTIPQWVALESLLAELRHWIPSITKVVGHREVRGSKTVCPGDNLTADMLRDLT